MYIIEIDIVRSSGIGITLSIVSGANSNWKYPTSSSLYFSRLEFSRGRSGGGLGEIRGRSYEELLEEVLGKQVLQIIVDAVVLVRRAGLAHAQYRKAEVLNLDARFGRRSFRRVVAALRVSLDPSPPMIMMIAADRRPTLRFPGTPTIPADFILPFYSSISRRSFSIVVTSIYIYRSKSCRRRRYLSSLTSRPWKPVVARDIERTRDSRLLAIHRNVGRPTTTNT